MGFKDIEFYTTTSLDVLFIVTSALFMQMENYTYNYIYYMYLRVIKCLSETWSIIHYNSLVFFCQAGRKLD